MAHKQDILKAVNRVVTAQKRSLAIGGLRDMTLTDQDSPGEETGEDEQARLSPPSLFGIRGADVS